ncbi:hypothetical protein D9613_000705 [Agrocybe pediades]|uniref:Ribonuclease H1 N-terminal domain-containing protein n=1 Tax=Agrocybe pediades TaxID=84607 RepID=A0A8H4R0Z2_9AGAR|nr:hypothetical protein D9613_000705 [Agrocybe pediades]
MVKRKWYVVTVGKGVGVYSTWLEAGPLVKGVSEAVHQSFRTEEEALQHFRRAVLSGNTRVVRSEKKQLTPKTDNVNTKTEASKQPSSVTSSRRYYEDSLSYAYGGTSSQPSSPSSINFQHRSTADPVEEHDPGLASYRRFQKINALFEQGSVSNHTKHRAHPATAVGAASATTPTSRTSSNVSSPSNRSSNTSKSSARVIVKTPSWLASYPQNHLSSAEPLSPLDSTKMPLNSFASRVSSTQQGASSLPIRQQTALPSECPGSPSSFSTSTRRSSAHATHNIDPRSPILNRRQVPELAFVSPLSFTRPSPMHGNAQLPPQSLLQSSMLFQIPSGN